MSDNDKKKQIAEMAKITCYVCEFGHDFNGGCDLGKDEPCYIALAVAEKLYETDYRKQIEGEWQERVEYNSIEDREYEYYQCSVCDLCRPFPTKFCPACGAKMKGGESDDRN